MTEVHQLPDRVLGDVLIDDLAALVVLDPDLAGETQVGAIEAEELSGGTLDPVEGLDHPVAGKVPVPGEGHHVVLFIGAVGVPGDVRDRLLGDRIGEGSESSNVSCEGSSPTRTPFLASMKMGIAA